MTKRTGEKMKEEEETTSINTQKNQSDAAIMCTKPKFTLYPELLVTDIGNESRSEPSSRTCSFKERSRQKSLVDAEEIKRRNSLPVSTDNLLTVDTNTRQVRRVRSFKMTNGQTDSKSRHSSFIENRLKRERFPSDNSDDSAFTCSCSSSCSTGYFRVLVQGAHGVGKTTLSKKFLSSEFSSSFDLSNDDTDDRTLTVLIDGEESTLEFIDRHVDEDCLENFLVDAYIVVFSVHDNESFLSAKETLHSIRCEQFSDRPIILVANKVDLVRKRQVTSEDAKQLAKDFDCKYTETSALLNHKVDELLLGLLQQIKLKLNPDVLERETADMIAQDDKPTSVKSPRKYIQKLFRKKSKTKSTCDNLFEP